MNKKLQHLLSFVDNYSIIIVIVNKKGEREMDFKKFIKENKNKINTLSEKNCKRNQEGKVVMEKSDSWRDETEWDNLYKELTGDVTYASR